MAKIFSFYNNKGGVAKTTTLFNVAVRLSQQGKKVLIVDCDPQCNCTELFFCSTDGYDDPEYALPGTSIFEALMPRFAGDTSRIDASTIDITESGLYSGLHLFRGDINFSRAEQYFSASIAQAVTESIHDKNTYAAMPRMLRDLAELHQFDYVFCDVGPSAGSITRMTVLSCDGFFVPTAPDRFSYQAVQGMGAIMNEWLSKHDLILETFSPYGIKAPMSKPKFYGAILNNYKIHRAGRMKESYQKWEALIAGSLTRGLLSGGESSPAVIREELKDNPIISSLRDVGPTAPVAQIVGRAIFDVLQMDTVHASSNGDYYRGVVWQGWEERMHEYRLEIEKIIQWAEK